MKFKSFGLLNTFISEVSHAWERISYMLWERELINIRYREDKKLWYVYVKPLSKWQGVDNDIYIITDEGHTIYMPDCISRLEWTGGSDKRTSWKEIDNNETIADTVNDLMLDNF